MYQWLANHRDRLALVLIMAIAIGVGFWLARWQDEPHLQVVSPPATPTRTDPHVYVSGAVISPGVYRIVEGDRVIDAISAAGGATDSANLTAINLAIRLKDEYHIHVPEMVAPGTSQPSSQPAKIDLNSATGPQLEALPGIGPVTAQRILDYREQNGPFANIDELVQAKIVTAATYDRIRGLITVVPGPIRIE